MVAKVKTLEAIFLGISAYTIFCSINKWAQIIRKTISLTETYGILISIYDPE